MIKEKKTKNTKQKLKNRANLFVGNTNTKNSAPELRAGISDVVLKKKRKILLLWI